MTPSAYAFDLYGTLVDFTSLRNRSYASVSDAVAFIDTWRAKQLQYAFLATLMARYEDFDQLTGHALDFAAAQHGASLGAAERAGLVSAWSNLPVYPEVPEVLAALRERGARLVVLSNGTPQAIASSLEAAKIASLVDGALSVDSVRAYKPSPQVYHLAVEFFGLPREQIGFVSSNGWDAMGAAEFGLRVYWCNRTSQTAETFGAKPTRTIANLRQLLD
jgi:2-haloacid dehalogenase